MWHDAFENLWNELFGSNEFYGINYGFWISLIVIGLLVILMQGFWFTKKHSVLVKEANWAKRELISLQVDKTELEAKIAPLEEKQNFLKQKLATAPQEQKPSIKAQLDELLISLNPLKTSLKDIQREIKRNKRIIRKVYKDEQEEKELTN